MDNEPAIQRLDLAIESLPKDFPNEARFQWRMKEQYLLLGFWAEVHCLGQTITGMAIFALETARKLIDGW